VVAGPGAEDHSAQVERACSRQDIPSGLVGVSSSEPGDVNPV